MNTTNVHIWRRSLACILAALVVIFSPGLSCYTAFAGPVESEGTPVDASIAVPGAEIPALNSAPINIQIPSASGQDNPALDFGADLPAQATEALPASAAGLEPAAPERAASAEPVKNAHAGGAVERKPVGALLPQSENAAAARASDRTEAPAPTGSLAAAEKTESAKIAKTAKVLATAHGADAQRKFLKALYDGIIPSKEERGAAVAAKSPAETGGASALSVPSVNSEKSEQTAEVPQPASSGGRTALARLWARRPSLRVLARHFLETFRDPRMIVYLGGLAATATAWAMHVPLAVTGILAAGTGAARGVFLAHKPKVGNFAKKALWRQGALLAASTGLYFAARSLSSDASLLLYAFSGTTAVVGLSPLAAKAVEIAKSIKESLVWISKFWGRIGKTGIKVKKQLAAASILAIGTSALSLIPPRYYGNMFQHLKDLLPSAAASHPAILHMYLAWGGVMLASYAAISVLNYFLSRFMYDIGNRMMAGLSNLFYEHVAKLPLSWHKSRPVGDVISTGTDAIYNVQSTATMVVVDTVKDLTLLIPSLAVMFYASWQMSLILLPTLFLALALPSSIYGNRSSEAYKWFFRDLKPRIASHIEQTEVNSETIKSAGKEEWEINRTRYFSHKTYIDGGEALARVNAPYRALSGGLTNFVQVGLVIAAALAVHAGIFTIPMATFYYFAANYSRQAVQDLCDTYVQLKSMKGSAAKFDKIMADQEEDYKENAEPLAPSSIGRAINFDHVSFGYRPSQPVLKEITLSAKPGQMIALVGESGSGKTTVTRLMLGLLKPSEGSIRIDGRDLSDINIKDFRSRVGTILQDPVPFDESMAYNIKYFKPEATEEQVMEAAKAAGFHDDIVRMGYGHNLEAVVPGQDLEHKIFNSGRHSLANRIFKRVLRALIGSEADKVMPLGSQRDETDRALVAAIAAKIVEARKILLGQDASAEIAPAKSILDNIAWGSGASLEDIVAAAKKAGIHDDIVRLGYNSRVGERGANLSGGQKQKLLLARLFLSAGQPWDIMILDEPTAALDGVTQQRIQDTLEARHGKTTIVMVAHRLSTVQSADKIVVFGKGAILEQGTHEELLRKKGVYAKLWEAQKLLDEAQQQPAAKP